MPDLPQDPMARVEAEVIRLRERAAQLAKELEEARAQYREQQTHGGVDRAEFPSEADEQRA
jgi:hypothetical protein